MKTLLILAVSVALSGVGGCAYYGKGKAPPPAPAATPIVTKG
ncbi:MULTISPECIES: hypothetical protein [unclassified Bosea (in: a-proteobacteria)]|nr:hypothetical protein [Bosea sp. BIWAKO-01]GAU80133.1 hypothetical protein BIWAKO_00019 [Bosea sp. BIWAKO-01]